MENNLQPTNTSELTTDIENTPNISLENNTATEEVQTVTPIHPVPPVNTISAQQINNNYNVQEQPDNQMIGFSIASMVLGILSICFICLYMFALVLSIPAIVFGYIALTKNYSGRGMAIAGIVTGVIGTILPVFYLIAFIVAM